MFTFSKAFMGEYNSHANMDYEQFIIKKYDLWDLYLHIRQFPYVGRCYAWAKREEAETVDDMVLPETLEAYHTILPEWRTAISKLFNHDTSNVSIMCNETRHLHVHFIPRYNTPRTVHDLTFIDHANTANYAPYAKPDLPNEFLHKVRDDISAVINGE